MAADHARGVRLKTSNDINEFLYLCETNSILKFFPEKYLNFSLHDHDTGDIKPIVKINVLTASQQHCSTTFYQKNPVYRNCLSNKIEEFIKFYNHHPVILRDS